MNIDWSKAPEDATHYNTGNKMFYCFSRGNYYFYALNNVDLVFGGSPEDYSDSTLIERPKKQEVWHGEGLPPVNCLCETFDVDANCWVRVEIYAHTELMGETYACAKNGTDMFYGLAREFRPIKTAEQVAAEEREKAIADMMEVTSDGISCIGKDDALALYKAGYRKQ